MILRLISSLHCQWQKPELHWQGAQKGSAESHEAKAQPLEASAAADAVKAGSRGHVVARFFQKTCTECF